MRDGFRVLGVAIRKEPWVFAASTLGSILFGALTVADAWVLGWSTEHAIIPAFETGEIDASILWAVLGLFVGVRSEEHTSELQSLMRISYAVFCLKKKTSAQKSPYIKIRQTKSL